jgi:serine protease Do
MGVALRDVDSDVQQALGLGRAGGALVEDVTDGSPAAHAGLRPYDVITAVDGRAVDSDDQTIRVVSRGMPGQTTRIEFLRDGRLQSVVLKLAERPPREQGGAAAAETPSRIAPPLSSELGLTLIEVHAGNASRYDVPAGLTGLLIQRVEPVSPAAEAGLERGQVLLHVNRRPVASVAALRQVVGQHAAGTPLAVLVYDPGINQRLLRVVRADAP